LSAPFVFDSTPTIRDNPLLRFTTFSFDEWYSAALSTDTGPLKRPLSMLSFAVNAAVSGLDSAFPFNLTNLVIHCANAILVFLCALLIYATAPRMYARVNVRGRCWIALIAAAIFLLHPIQLPAVLHTVQRMTELSCTFVLLGILAYLRARPRILHHGFEAKAVVEAVTLIGLCTALGALCKENALLLPWLVLVIEWTLFGFVVAGRRSRWLRYVCIALLIAPFVAASVYFGYIRPEALVDMYAKREFTAPERLLTEARVLWMYLYWFIIPTAPSSGLHHDDIAIAKSLWDPLTAIAVIAWASVALLIVAGVQRFPVIVFAVAWYLVAHSLESTIVPLELVYEHRNYVAIFGLAVLIADALWRILRDRTRWLGAMILLAIMLLLAVPLGTRASVWSDELTLAANQLSKHPGSLRSRYHFANVHLRLADASTNPAEQQRAVIVAEHYYRSMLELDPDDLVGLVSLLYLDGKYLSGRNHNQLYADLLLAIDKPLLLPTDYNALTFLQSCSAKGLCIAADREYWAVIEALDKRTDLPRGFVLLLRARYLAEAHEDTDGAAKLLHSVKLPSEHQFLQYHLLIKWQMANRDLPAALQTVRAMYAEDRMHSQLATLRALTSLPRERG